MKTSADNRRIGLLLTMVRNGSLVPRPDFQRRSVWTSPDKIAFIETILLGFPFPEIYISAGSVDTVSGEAKEKLVDGQQRLNTLESYFKGVSPFKNKNKQNVKRYRDLAEHEKQAFLGYEVAVRNLGQLDDDTIRQVFRRMNRTSYNLNEMERYNAVYFGELKQFSEIMAGNVFFAAAHIFSANDIRRMRDVSYVASLVATMMSSYFNRDENVEDYLANYNDKFQEKDVINSRFLATFDYMNSLGLPANSRAWRKVDFYTLFIEIDRKLYKEKKRPDPEIVGEKLREFFAAVEQYDPQETNQPNVISYIEAAARNTNDRGQRIARGDIIRAILDKVPSADFQLPIVNAPPPSEDETELDSEPPELGLI